ncbi:hypothetical protein BCR42DRAFT_419245 [Absidia repens]|uniref:Uncharacterized protein n=1 Tax=Absidia repens TaxID=90262 RepID=A0A1X2IB10_9FUNG|nr:hypothetical protein BCR42DRAFT_419245 [Absidia repens]
MHTLPQPPGTEDYKRIPFQFTEELSSKNVFVRLPECFTPLERMILQASGNLQRLISAYYNVPSHVDIIKNNVIPTSPLALNGTCQQQQICMQYDRKARICFDKKLAYEADSILYVKDQNVLDLIEKHKYGLGQIFGHTRRSPDFMLLAVGRHGTQPGSSFWRDYSLRIPDVLDCFIRETFVEGLFDEESRSSGQLPNLKNTSDSTNGHHQQQGTIWYNQPIEQ